MSKYFLIPISVFFMQGVMGQSSLSGSLGFPSANNSFLGKPEPLTPAGSLPIVGVDYYTGAAQVSVPICNLASRELTIPVSVDYVDGRGVKVQETASQVGLGWQLNAGGSITRVVRGFPDELPNGYLGTGTLPTILPGVPVLPSGTRWGQVVYNSFTGNPANQVNSQSQYFLGFDQNFSPTTATADGEPDLFYVKTPFFNFEFAFNASGQAVFLNNSGFKIISSNFFNTPGPAFQSSSFEVLDDRGNQFYFGSSAASSEQTTDSLYGKPYTFISTWYLDKIVSYNSRDVINLTYQASTVNDYTYNYSWTELINPPSPSTVIANTGRIITINPKYVSTISSSLGEIDFSYMTNGRQDDIYAFELLSVVLKAYNPQTGANSTTLQTYNFSYSFFGSPSTDPNVIRLRLDGIKMTGNTSATSSPLTLAALGYNTTINLPNRTWPISDYWGYCNGTATSPPNWDIAGMPLLASATYDQADILTSVSNMIGGTWMITYEPNSDQGGPPVDGVRVKQITQTAATQFPAPPSTTMGSYTKTYQYVDNIGNPSGRIISALYSVLSYQLGGGFLDLSSSPYELNDVNGISLGYSHVKEINPDGGYTIYSFTNFADQLDPEGIGFNDLAFIKWESGPYTSNNSSTTTSLITNDLSEKRGLLTDVTLYTATGSPIVKTAYSYAPLNTITPVPKDAYGMRGITNSNNGNSESAISMYYTPIENYRLTSTVRTDYDQANPTTATPMTSTTNYIYDPINNRLVLQTSTTDSKGQTHTQTVYHAEDIAGVLPNPNGIPNTIPMLTPAETSAINTMVGGNYTSAVIHTIDNRNNTITQLHNAYGIMQTGSFGQVILPTSRTTYANDLVNTTATVTNQANYIYDPVYTNLISSSLAADITSTSQYLYHSSLPVAMVTNAGSYQFFFQGFEETGGNVSTNAHTGNMSYSGSYTVPFTIPDSRIYLIQWWSYQGSPASWVFNQQTYTNGKVLTGLIDDVRVFPTDALMTTCTYNPLVGKTSETDPSGRSVVNQFDGLNRLQTVRDQDGNVLKQYEYKYQLLPSTGSTGLVLTGVPGYGSGGPTTGQGSISGPVGYLVTVTFYANGSPGHPCGLNVQVTGAVSNGPTSVTDGTASFTFIMPSSGSVSWQASLVPTGPGGGAFSIQ